MLTTLPPARTSSQVLPAALISAFAIRMALSASPSCSAVVIPNSLTSLCLSTSCSMHERRHISRRCQAGLDRLRRRVIVRPLCRSPLIHQVSEVVVGADVRDRAHCRATAGEGPCPEANTAPDLHAVFLLHA